MVGVTVMLEGVMAGVTGVGAGVDDGIVVAVGGHRAGRVHGRGS